MEEDKQQKRKAKKKIRKNNLITMARITLQPMTIIVT